MIKNIPQKGFVLLVERQRHESNGEKTRTVGKYSVWIDGQQLNLPNCTGDMLETRGPGDNSDEGHGHCIEAGTYPLHTQDGEKYVTIGFVESDDISDIPRPGILVGDTDARVGIVIHPGIGFLSSIGCLNPSDNINGPNDDIDFSDSRDRVETFISILEAYLKDDWPDSNGQEIPNAHLVIVENFKDEE